MTTQTIGDLLHGARPGRAQHVGLMTVIPLTSDLTDERFVSPAEAGARISTSTYGTLVFDNPGAALMIVPCHAGLLVKQAAQDHALPAVELVPARAHATVERAMCIQQSQGGLIGAAEHRLTILPFQLREPALGLRGQVGYSRLWGHIEAFNRSLGVARTGGHLEWYFERFARELDDFVAEFEAVPGQVGAIVLVDDVVVGVERAPSHAYWAAVWPALIRGCYGALALDRARRRGHDLPPAGQRPLPGVVGSLDALAAAVAEAEAAETTQTLARVRELVARPLAVVERAERHGLTVETVSDGPPAMPSVQPVAPAEYVGQVIREDDRVVYASICRSLRGLRRAAWAHAEPFVI